MELNVDVLSYLFLNKFISNFCFLLHLLLCLSLDTHIALILFARCCASLPYICYVHGDQKRIICERSSCGVAAESADDSFACERTSEAVRKIC